MTFYDSKGLQQQAEKAVAELTERYNDKLNNIFSSVETKQMYERFCNQQRQVKNQCSDKDELSTDFKEFMADYACEIKRCYMQYLPHVYHASNNGKIDILMMSKRRLNHYQNKIKNCVFAFSGYDMGCKYIIRAAAGGMSVIKKRLCIYNSNPFMGYEEDDSFSNMLISDVYVYSLKVESFKPEIGLILHEGDVQLSFSNEWTVAEKQVPISMERIDYIPGGFFKSYDVYCTVDETDNEAYAAECRKRNTYESCMNYLTCMIKAGKLLSLKEINIIK